MPDVIPPSACAGLPERSSQSGTPADRPVVTIEELTAERDAALEEVRKLRKELNERDIQFEQFKIDVRRLGLGILGRVGLTFDDLHAWHIKREEKRET